MGGGPRPHPRPARAAGGSDQPRERARPRLRSDHPPSGGPRGAPVSPRVLVVDDDPEIVDAVGEALQDDGYLVETATDGATALKRVLEAPPDLIVLDVRMPNLNGWEFCEIIRRQSHTRDVPVLFLTACSEVRDQITAMQVGGSDHLPKPFRLAALRDKVRSLTREAKTQGGS
ncbi:MAG: hypothetical protein DMF83_19585 [Acidobacteria bacterium]|nr:MAG: hypothetical protein DMF83_19585 [Acidobacteriota bacterium]